MVQHFDAPVNTPRPTSAHSCDTCTRPVGTVAPITIADTTRQCCRFCRHSLRYGRLSNILRLVDRFFDGMVTT
jgi:hypothetical protein